MSGKGLRSIAVRRIDARSAGPLFEMLQSASPGYSEYFTPFELSLSAIRAVLEKAVGDQFYGIYVSGRLAGLFMLRGFDQGYAIPSFGVWIAEKYQSKGLSKLAIHYSMTVCRMNGIGRLMLKVYPQNEKARRIYEQLGFEFQGMDPKNGNRVYIKEL